MQRLVSGLDPAGHRLDILAVVGHQQARAVAARRAVQSVWLGATPRVPAQAANQDALPPTEENKPPGVSVREILRAYGSGVEAHK
jgi:hypothetical protein